MLAPTNQNLFVVGLFRELCEVDKVHLTSTISGSVLSGLAEEAVLLPTPTHTDVVDR